MSLASDEKLTEIFGATTGAGSLIAKAPTISSSSVVRASAALTSSYVAGTAVAVPAGMSWALLRVSYTGGSGSTNGAASHKVLIGDGTYQGTGPDGTYTVIAGVSAAASATSYYAIGPVNVRGSSYVNVSSVESGDTAHVGTCAISVVFG